MPEITYLEAIRTALWEEMKRDERVFIIGEDIGRYGGAFGVTHGMLDEFGEKRIIETPISEPSIIGAAVGAALLGMRPVAEIMFMDFTLLTFDQLGNQAAKMHYMFGGKGHRPHGGTHAQWFGNGCGCPAFPIPGDPVDAHARA